MNIGDEVHGNIDGHVLMMIKLNLEKKKEKNKNREDQGKVMDIVLHSRHHRGCE